MPLEGPKRRRDPDRKRRILETASELIGRHGYHNVSMAEIGSDSGIVGSGIYRHFDSKAAILAALLGQAMEKLLRAAVDIAVSAPDDGAAVTALVRTHIEVAIIDRRILQVYHREAHNLPEVEMRKIRRLQRKYVEEWQSVVGPLRRELADAEVKLLVLSAIGAIQSILFFNSGLPRERIVEILDEIAHACLGVDAAEPLPTAGSSP